MNNGRKRVKQNEDKETDDNQKFKTIYRKLCSVSVKNQEHPFEPMMRKVQSQKHPILPTLNQTGEVYKQNNDKRKKPVEVYLDAVNTIYKKKDLDILISPLSYNNVFENWSPRQIAIFQQAILKFGKQFEFIAELIETKNSKQVYQFYLEWKTTSHFKSYRMAINAQNRSNLEEWV